MKKPANTPHVSAEKARGGEIRHEVRYILAISLVLIIAIFAFLFLR